MKTEGGRVLPYVFEGGGPAASTAGGDAAWVGALRRLGIFYDAVVPVLALVGLLAHRAAVHARRVLAGALLAGGAILVLRYVAPTALRDAKDVELMLAPVAVLGAAGLAVVWGQGRTGRATAVLALAAALGWSLLRDWALYADRFLAVGR